MRKDLLTIALGLCAFAGIAGAEVVSMPEGQAAAPTMLPAKGSTMTEVKKKFGDPRDKKPTVGGDTPKHPPITRWDYDGFVVIFEKDRVVDAVVPGAPPKLRSTSGLTPATNAPPPPEMPTSEVPVEPIVPETPPDQPPPPAEPAAEASPVIPEAPAAEAPPPDQPPPAAEPAAPAEAAPASPPPDQPAPVAPGEFSDAPPTPK